MKINRRDLIANIGALSGAILLSGCSNRLKTSFGKTNPDDEPVEKEMDGEVTAIEDLMREHGVLRRALFIYSESASRLRTNPSSVSAQAIYNTAALFRTFGEDYHEKKLEETYIFPQIKKTSTEAAAYPDILIAQHNRGRQITDYILAVTEKGRLNTDNIEQLAMVLDSFVRMYRPHAAREDTIVFPAWKHTLTPKQLDQMNERFEDIEHEMFGADGFENAVRQIASFESRLGMADLAKFTAPVPD